MPKISALSALSAFASGDKIPIVDISDTTESAQGTTKYIELDKLESQFTTKVIAPANAGYAADYYTDGTDDDVQIMEAFNSVSSGLVRVIMRPGTYNARPDQITLPIYGQLKGEGYTTLLKLQTTGKLLSLVSNAGLPDGFRLFNAIEDIRLDGNTFLSSTGIYCGLYGQEFMIRNCWFHNFGNRHDTTISSFAIDAGGTNKKFHIMQNFFGGSQNGNSCGIRLATTGDVEIVGNNFHDFYEAIRGNTEKTQIVGNNIYHGDWNGINVGTTAGGLTTLNITGNTISDLGNHGIHIGLTDARGVVIVGNYFRNIDNNAIWLRGLYHTINSNYFQNIARTGAGNEAAGITVNDGGNEISIHNNKIYNTHSNMTYGIAILSTATPGSNSLKDNSVTGASLSAYRTGQTNNIYEGQTEKLLNGDNAYTQKIQAGTVSNTAGKAFTLEAGAATSSSTNKNGGDLIISSGIPTGSGTSKVQIKTGPASAADLTAIATRTLVNRGSGYTVSDVLTVTGGGGSGGQITVVTVAAAGELLSIGVNNGGTGYVIGDVLTISVGTGGTFTVKQVDWQGKILTLSLTTSGSGYSTTTGVATTGGTGTGATVDTNVYATGAIKSQSLTANGTGYVLTSGAAVSGGTGTGATFDITTGAEVNQTLTTKVTVLGNGNVGIGQTSPTASVHIQAGTAVAGTAPLKFATGTNMTTPEAGAIEYDGTNLYFTNSGGTRLTLATTTGTDTQDVKESVRASTTANITLSGEQTIDGIACVTGDRVLVKDQSTGSQNGIYVVASGAWLRSSDADTSADVTGGMHVFVNEGTLNADSWWTLSTNDPITLGSTSLTFSSGLNLVIGNVSSVGNITMAPDAARNMTVGRNTTTTGSNLTVQAGGALSGGTNLNGGSLILSGGIATGNGGSAIEFHTTRDSQGSGTTDRTPAVRMVLSSSNNGRLFIGNTATNGSVDGLEMGGLVARTVQTARHTTANTAGNNLTIKSGGATSGATDKNAGDLILSSGISTGTGFGRVLIQTAPAGGAGTSDNTPATMIEVNDNKIGFFNVTPVVRQTELTDELTTITHTSPGTPDYAIQNLTNTTPYGFVTQDEGNTVLSVIANLQARVNELETKLTAYGLLIDAD